MSECHVWFNKAVARWLDIALYKAMQRIIKVHSTSLLASSKIISAQENNNKKEGKSFVITKSEAYDIRQWSWTICPPWTTW